MAVYSLSFTQKVTLKNIKIRQIFYSTNGIILSGGFLKQTVHLLILDLVLAGPFRVWGTGLENCSFSSIVANLKLVRKWIVKSPKQLFTFAGLPQHRSWWYLGKGGLVEKTLVYMFSRYIKFENFHRIMESI